jgi:RNA polymerase sigma factor (TIGR02999 family)
MSEVTRILEAVEAGDTAAGEKLLPLAYDELRKMAAQKMASEQAGHTLQPTALVHEAYLRLAGPDGEERKWNSRGHFFSAAAEAMRRILIESARKKGRLKRGGDLDRATWDESKVGVVVKNDELLAVHDALSALEEEDPDLARVVKLRYFAGLTVEQTAAAFDTSPRTINRQWKCARAWLHRHISESG